MGLNQPFVQTRRRNATVGINLREQVLLLKNIILFLMVFLCRAWKKLPGQGTEMPRQRHCKTYGLIFHRMQPTIFLGAFKYVHSYSDFFIAIADKEKV